MNLFYETDNKLTGIENKLWLPKGKGRWNKLGVWC